MATGSIFMHGHTVEYESDGDDHGLRYLEQLDQATAKDLFDHAYRHGSVEFQDQHGRSFVLEKQGNTGYRLVGR